VGELAVGGGVAAIATMGDDRDFRRVLEKVCDETSEVRAHALMIAGVHPSAQYGSSVVFVLGGGRRSRFARCPP
jgi:hypothetical protein